MEVASLSVVPEDQMEMVVLLLVVEAVVQNPSVPETVALLLAVVQLLIL
jgi:hypothetical protein